MTISHTTGADGETIGRTVAHRLGFRYIDEEIITLAASRGPCYSSGQPAVWQYISQKRRVLP